MKWRIVQAPLKLEGFFRIMDISDVTPPISAKKIQPRLQASTHQSAEEPKEDAICEPEDRDESFDQTAAKVVKWGEDEIKLFTQKDKNEGQHQYYMTLSHPEIALTILISALHRSQLSALCSTSAELIVMSAPQSNQGGRTSECAYSNHSVAQQPIYNQEPIDIGKPQTSENFVTHSVVENLKNELESQIQQNKLEQQQLIEQQTQQLLQAIAELKQTPSVTQTYRGQPARVTSGDFLVHFQPIRTSRKSTGEYSPSPTGSDHGSDLNPGGARAVTPALQTSLA
uniref:Uncharacterized protein n=1 Tax=Ditylenchus dipsaci TaxID=166011 RepID=A0A915DID9_9BILA